MSDPPRRRGHASIWFAAVLALILAACVGVSPPSAAAPPASGAPAAPSASVGDPSTDPGAAVDVDALLGAAAANDGKVVRVTGNFLADETTAQLCALLMESYPPQCGGGVRLTGTVPAATLDVLDTTTEPDLKKMWWGYVTVTGTFDATGEDGQPSLEIETIELVEG